MKKNSSIPKKNIYIFLLFFSFCFFIIIYLGNIYNITTYQKKLPTKNYIKKNIAVRGPIISKDNFTITKSTQVYKAIIDTRYLDFNKKELFISLFSIYTNIKKEKIRKKLDNQKKLGKLVLSYNINSRTKANLNKLRKNFLSLKIFRPKSNKNSFIIGLDVVISGDKRLYPYKDTLTPFLGHIQKYNLKNGFTKIKGVNGLEKFYNEDLDKSYNGIIKGQRDLVGDIVFNKGSIYKSRKDGEKIYLNIPLKLQIQIEDLASKYKKKFKAKEILIAIMNSKNGKILSLATSNRYFPKKINKNQISFLNITAIGSSFEPGSVIKPLTMGLVFNHNRVNLGERISAFNGQKRDKSGRYYRGKYKIKRHTIGDDHRFKTNYITPTDIIVYSSNIGILQLAQRLNANEFLNGFRSFGLSKKTNIDLKYEQTGILHKLKQYKAYENKNEDNIYKATDSYGQGITTTFVQLLKAYSVFNNNGYIVTPKLAQNKYFYKEKVLKKNVANIIKKMLIKTVKFGTGKGTDIDGIEIGGKTGTSQIARHGKYQKEYISSFFGFANDINNKYTIGVTVFNPIKKYHYASQSAVPIFKNTINLLLKEGYLNKNKKFKDNVND